MIYIVFSWVPNRRGRGVWSKHGWWKIGLFVIAVVFRINVVAGKAHGF